MQGPGETHVGFGAGYRRLSNRRIPLELNHVEA